MDNVKYLLYNLFLSLGLGFDLYGPSADYSKFDFYTHNIYECYSGGVCLGADLAGTSYENSTGNKKILINNFVEKIN